ncbi:MAG: N-acetyl-gamma-glutamyl-phosphate reductase [Candidatus Geothermarchaeales archaeon]
MRAAIVGAAGYTGGELLRLLLMHPEAEIVHLGSRSRAGEYVHKTHPNLRGLCMMKFEEPRVNRVSEAEVVFLAVPHGAAMNLVKRLIDLDLKIIDLSADFRIKDPKIYEEYYREHTCPELLQNAIYGIPELHREEIKGARLVANPGCIAAASILGLAPIIKLVDPNHIVVDVKIGSSAAGERPTVASHHPERVDVVRTYKPSGHRHTAEIEQEVGLVAGRSIRVGLTPHAVGMVRGVLATIHTYPNGDIRDKEVWSALRNLYRGEPFIRLVKERKILYSLPNPKILAGSNFCDIGFSLDHHTDRLIMFSALDNLVKGGAGNAIQNMNLMFGLDEKTGLQYAPPHP